MLLWVGILFLGAIGAAMIIWRKEFALIQAMAFGARLPAGCAVAEGLIILLLVLAFCLLYAFGIIPLRS
jgi:hypothetical protein